MLYIPIEQRTVTPEPVRNPRNPEPDTESVTTVTYPETDFEPVSTGPKPVTDPEPVSTESVTAGVGCTTGAVVDMINLTSTITDEDHILWPNEEVIFTCETRGFILVHEWTSDDYIGDGISLIFDNMGDEVQSGSKSNATLIRVDYNYVMVSQLHIRTSSLFQTSSVACTNHKGTSKKIIFSVLGKSM